MTDVSPIKYRAFLSYSHRDAAIGKWLHKALESYRVDRAFVGARTAAGEIPRTLRPIFRDRDDFPAGHSLTEQTIAALEASQFLVVVCSPHAAKSAYVNEEVRRFKALGRANRVLPIIVDGEPNDPQNECFPHALRVTFDAAGLPTGEVEEPVAADARSTGDGRQIAFLKIVAGLLGVGLDEIVQREERARRRRIRTLTTVALTFLFLVVAATVSSVVAYKKLVESEERLNQAVEIAYGFVSEATALSDRFGVPTDVALNLLRRADSTLTELLSQGANSETLRFRRALMLDSFSDNYERLGQTAEALERARASNEILLQLANSDRSTPEWKVSLLRSIVRNGVLLTSRRERSEALNAYREGLRYAQTFLSAHPEDTAIAAVAVRMHINIGDVLLTTGGVSEAEKSYIGGLKLIVRLANGGDDLRDLAAATTKYPYLAYISNEAVDRWTTLQNGLGHFEQALKYRVAVLAYTEEAAARDLQSASAQWNLLNANLKVGESYLDAGAVEQSESAYRKALSIGRQLAAADPSNVIWRRLTALAADGVGRALLAKGDAANALATFRLNLKEARPFIEADEQNLVWRGLLAVGHEHVGDCLLELGQFDQALAEFESARRVSEQLIQRGGQSADLRVRIAASHYKIGEALLAAGQLEGAAESFETSYGIWRDQIGADPALKSVVGYQAYLLRAHWRLSYLRGDVAAYRSAQQGLMRLASQKMLDAEASLWLRKQESRPDTGNGADDVMVCLGAPAPNVIDICTKAIQRAQATKIALARAYNARAVSLQAVGRIDESLRDLDEALRLNDGFAAAYSNRGYSYAARGDFDRAIVEYDRAITIDAGSAVSRGNRGLALSAVGRFDEAIADFDEALRLGGASAALYDLRGSARIQNGRVEQALADFGKAIEHDPGYANAYSNRGVVYVRMEKFGDALEDLSKAVRLRPGHFYTHMWRGVALLGLGQGREAFEDFDHAVRLNPGDAFVLTSRGRAHEMLGRYDEAIADHTNAISRNPRLAAAHLNLARAYEGKGKLPEAAGEYQAALAIDSSLALAREGLERVRGARN